MGYAGLTDLLAPSLASWQDRLPGHLAEALTSSLLLSAPSGQHDQLAVYRGTQLALEVLAAGGQGLLVAVDDVQWLDPASARAIGYALRRWSGPPVAVAVTWREGTPEPIGLDTLPGGLTLVELAPLSSRRPDRAARRPGWWRATAPTPPGPESVSWPG